MHATLLSVFCDGIIGSGSIESWETAIFPPEEELILSEADWCDIWEKGFLMTGLDDWTILDRFYVRANGFSLYLYNKIMVSKYKFMSVRIGYVTTNGAMRAWRCTLLLTSDISRFRNGGLKEVRFLVFRRCNFFDFRIFARHSSCFSSFLNVSCLKFFWPTQQNSFPIYFLIFAYKSFCILSSPMNDIFKNFFS